MFSPLKYLLDPPLHVQYQYSTLVVGPAAAPAAHRSVHRKIELQKRPWIFDEVPKKAMEVLFIYTRPCTKVCRAAGACNCCEREVRAIAHSLTHAGWPCRAAAVHQVLDGMGSSSASRQLQVVVLPVVTGGRRSLECTNGGRCPVTAMPCRSTRREPAETDEQRMHAADRQRPRTYYCS